MGCANLIRRSAVTAMWKATTEHLYATLPFEHELEAARKDSSIWQGLRYATASRF